MRRFRNRDSLSVSTSSLMLRPCIIVSKVMPKDDQYQNDQCRDWDRAAKALFFTAQSWFSPVLDYSKDSSEAKATRGGERGA